jgi:hypothetical protein
VVDRRGERPGVCGLGRRSAVGPSAQQFPGVRIEKHQRGDLNADADAAASQNLRGEQPIRTNGDKTCLGNGAVDFHGGTGLDRGQRRGAVLIEFSEWRDSVNSCLAASKSFFLATVMPATCPCWKALYL